MTSLKGKVAVVTGASRGGGRGIALGLGEAGATVYITGRSTRSAQTAENLPQSNIDVTAGQVTARGGVGIPVRSDHMVDAEVEALFERVKEEQGRLDILVNNAWSGYEDYDKSPFDSPFWEQPFWRWDKMFTVGVRSHMVSCWFGAQLMLPRREGLIINTTTYMPPDKYDNGSPFYDIAKTAINRMAFVMAHDLRPYNISIFALAPGWMRTEVVLQYFHTDEQNWSQVEALKDTESTHYIGRAVVALASDPNVIEKTGRVLRTGDLAPEYGFTDIDGRQPQFYDD